MNWIDTISISQSSITTQATTRSVATPAQQPAAAYTGTKARTSTVAVTDEATLSRASLLISQALAQPDIRVAKVAQIQEALAAGTYHVTSSDLAGKLIDSLQTR